MGTCRGTEVEVILNNDYFWGKFLEEWLDIPSGYLGKPEPWLRFRVKEKKKEREGNKNEDEELSTCAP